MDNKLDEQYLSEDEDLLRQLDAPTTGAPVKAAERMQELASLQIKAMLRNRKTMDEFNSATAFYSKILIYFTALLISIAFFQILIAIFPPQNMFLKWSYLIAALICVVIGLIFTSKALDE